MLGRAVQSYQPPSQRKETLAISKAAATNQEPSSAVPRGIDDMMRNGPKNSQKSISGWTNTQSTTPSLGPSMAVSSEFPRTSSYSRPTTAASRVSNGPKRTSSEMSGIAAVLGRQDSFEDKVRGWDSISRRDSRAGELSTRAKASDAIELDTDTIDLTQEDAPSKFHAPQPAEFDFDPDDFEDDNELDLEMEFPLSLPPITAPRLPFNSVSINNINSPPSMPPPRLPSTTPQHLHITSSAQTWSSSPLSHKVTPIKRSIPPQPEPVIPFVSSEPSIDANPRPAKRRTLPWAQQASEERERQENEKSLERERQEKEKLMPWNTTASQMEEKRKAFKDHQRMVKEKQKKMSMDEMFKTAKHVRKEPSKPTSIFLSAEQRNVLALVAQQKKSVFFTGSAGTGKSVLMRHIIAELRQIYKKEADRVAVTASTGLAACNIGGVTLHSFGGIGLGKESVPDLVKKIMKNSKARNRWLRTKVLVIDEVSMVDGELFDKLEGIARFIKKNGRPFGGIQLVVTGDFFQLPPVPDYGKKVKFAFDADTWTTSIHHTIGLTEVFRQRDPEFANMLNEMRLGKISDATLKAFRRLDRPLEACGLDATELFPTRNEVENSNFMKMRNLQGASKIYLAEDGGSIKDPQQLERLLQNFMAPKKLELKKGAQVMLIKNMDDNLVNGSLGKVIGFMNEKTFEIYEDHEAIEPGSTEAAPDEEGMGDNFTEAKKKLKSMMNKNLIGDTGKEYPLVRFLATDGSSRDLLCQPEDWKIELPNGEVQAQRRQIPLILAWALSIHKAQGQTLERVKVDLKKVFENGQAYVALSRATTQEGLWVQNFNAKAVMAHPRVGEFYNSLYSVNSALKQPKVHALSKLMKDPKAALESRAGPSRTITNNEWDDDEEAMAAAYG